jgi:hypothetical protein
MPLGKGFHNLDAPADSVSNADGAPAASQRLGETIWVSILENKLDPCLLSHKLRREVRGRRASTERYSFFCYTFSRSRQSQYEPQPMCPGF